MIKKSIAYSTILLLFLFLNSIIAKTPVPKSSQQMILVITDSTKATTGSLYIFQYEKTTDEWQQVNDLIPISLGRSGLGNGIGLHNSKALKVLPLKKEGDGRSPAGIFSLSAVFGSKSPNEMLINMPYIHITEMIECVDDATSDYYNNVVSKDSVTVDWKSSEKMSRSKVCYAQGIVVDHNMNPVTKGSGSCIFIHNWYHAFETTAGCTVMEPTDLTKIINWLDSDKNPVLVQLTKSLYNNLEKKWKLPVIGK